ncbi:MULTISPECIES: CAP family protein [Nocardia]|uniref:CAP family protein n=1 Tax=Nocardia implantans TaxID=3108168 RepID=A0ABU6AWL5_9NOCA|nr:MULTISPECIES: CAP family protein [unclassified Nocardia]MBF6193982.1 secretion protein [Nocardia beijingensis]MEA3529279.1 CAP family protein [Nocardia sp. CDC192]MEB3511865.1 CAP family protein [Nocardia sp. CDC186]
MRVGRLVSVVAAVMLAAFVAGGGPAAGQSNYAQTGLTLHNQYRAKHGSPAMTLTQNLNNLADQCAKYYAQKRTIDHSCPYKNGAGENLVGGQSTYDAVSLVQMGTKMWYDEIKEYDFNNPGFSMRTGHFTQVVWKASTRLGIGYASEGGWTAVVALYNPPGNVQGQFPQNVVRPR